MITSHMLSGLVDNLNTTYMQEYEKPRGFEKPYGVSMLTQWSNAAQDAYSSYPSTINQIQSIAKMRLTDAEQKLQDDVVAELNANYGTQRIMEALNTLTYQYLNNRESLTPSEKRKFTKTLKRLLDI